MMEQKGGTGVETIQVWTKQHRAVLEELERIGRYTAKKAYVELENGDCAPIILEAYNWLVGHAPGGEGRPADAEYPVWVSFSRDLAMLPQEDHVLLELTVDRALVTPIHVAKWGTILNYSYLPQDEADAQRHRALLQLYRVSDTQAYLSQFYPEIKREIVASWDRLFDDTVQINSDLRYGVLWEVQRTWVTQVIQ